MTRNYRMKLSKDAWMAVLVVAIGVVPTVLPLLWHLEFHSNRILVISLIFIYLPLSVLIFRLIQKKMADKSSDERQVCMAFTLIFALIMVFILNLPAGMPQKTYVNANDEIVLKNLIGRDRTIPLTEITEYELTDSLMMNLVRTNGFGMGTYRSGYFESTATGRKLYLFLTGKDEKRCFEYEGLLYVVDDWKK